MARTTRSTAATTTTGTTNQQPQCSSPAHASHKKRKRVKAEDEDAQRCPKRHESHLPELAAEAVIIDDGRILDILELADTLGLLDRVFPVLHSDSDTASLRTLLQQPRPFPVLCAAVQHLIPIASDSRATPSPTAVQQLRFCNLALTLLKQAPVTSAIVSLSLSDVIAAEPSASSSESRPLRYALVQHLPSGDYWTSLNTDADLSTSLTQLPTAHAELVAILPTPPPTDTKPPPNLGAYISTKPLTMKLLPAHRSVSTGSFLDYGPWTSFAPSCDHNGEVVGPIELAHAVYASHEKRKSHAASLRRVEESRASVERILEDQLEDSDVKEDIDTALQELFSPEEAASIKVALDTLELQNAVEELLNRNRRALVRLEELQISRLFQEGDKSDVAEGSEEWELAQGILATLEVVCSIRPRVSPSVSTAPMSILPPISVLRKLHRTMALEPSPGWYGTLPAKSYTALHDDITVRKSRSAPTVTTAASSTTTTATTSATLATPATVPVAAANPVAMPYSGYAFSYGVTAQQQQQQQHQYRPQMQNGTAAVSAATQYSAYAPQFYSYAAAAQQLQQQQNAATAGTVPTAMQMQASYYGQQQQGYASAAYSGWYNPYATTALTVTGGGSGRGTPQPQPQTQAQATQATPVQMAGQAATQATAAYGNFLSGAAAAAVAATARTPAVANTVYAPQVGTSTPPVLPAHLRIAQPQASAPSPASAATQ